MQLPQSHKLHHLLRKNNPNLLHLLLLHLLPSLLKRKQSLSKANQLRRTTKSPLSPLRSNSKRVIVYSLEDEEYEVWITESIHRGFNRPKLVENILDEDSDLPEYIRWRLFLARQSAILKYREIHG